KGEIQLAGGQRFQRIAVAGPVAVVEHVDMAGAVVARGDVALEGSVLQRVVLDLDGQPLLARAQRRPFRHSPAPERTVDLEPEVVMARTRMVQLDDEDRAMSGRTRGIRGRLRRAV